MLDLCGCRAKIERAKKHIVDFDRERVYFLGSDPYVVITKFNQDAGVTESILGPLPVIPISLSLTAADAIQNLRTALDYLAVELVRSAGGVPKPVYFPITETAQKYIAESEGKTKGMPKEAKEIIDRIEPYFGGKGQDLWFLHSLNIADKHRLLMSIGVNLGQQTMMSLSPQGNTFTTLVHSPWLKEGYVLGSVTGNSEGQERIKFSFDIAFGQPDAIAGEPVLQTLEYLVSMVEDIVSIFSSGF